MSIIQFTFGLLICAIIINCSRFDAEDRAIVESDPKNGKIPSGWSEIPDEDIIQRQQTVKLTFALTQRNRDVLEMKFWEVSTPSNPNYKKYLTFEEIKDLVAPTEEDILQIVEWLESYGVYDYQIHQSGDFLTCTMEVDIAERMLKTKFKRFLHENSGRTILKAMGSYSVPRSISNKIDFISGFRFPNFNSKFRKAGPIRRGPSQAETAPSLVYVNPLDEIAILTILPRCRDGSVTSSLDLCSDQGSSIQTFIVYSNQSRYGVNYFIFDPAQAKCVQCSQAEGHVQASCTDYNQKFDYPADTVYCDIPVQPLENYVQIIFGLLTEFDDETWSELNWETDFPIWLGKFTTPQELYNLYNIPAGTMVNQATQSVAEFLGQYYSQNDLDIFFQLMGVPNTPVVVVGPNNQTLPGGEATLDIEFIMGLAPNATTYFWSLGDLHDGQEPFLEWITDVLNDASSPYVHSISYGDDEDSLTQDFMDRCNAEFMKAGTRGISLLFASGDNGVYGGGSPIPLELTKFVPSFPPTSPYVTAVGGTLYSTQTIPICNQNFYGFNIPCHIIGETTSSTSIGSRITSGGGFSDVYDMPSYQVNVATNYAATLGIPGTFYNNQGRAYPDIAAMAHNFLVILGGEIVPIDGTSAATPTAAAIITLLNDYLLKTGSGPLGFLNPWLYTVAATNSTAFNDIKTGDNSCSELPWVCADFGFPAEIGYDAVTGVGSLNYGVLLNVLKGL